MKIIVTGACGRMGAEVLRLIAADYHGATLAAAVDVAAPEQTPFVYKKISDISEGAEVIIDFSHHSAASELTGFAVSRKIPLVIATTGHTPGELDAIKKASETVPIFMSANMSVGVALLCELAKKTAAAMSDADIEIVEIHHNRKLDAPSGTALLLGNAVKEARPNARLVFGREGKRQINDITFHSLRMGNIVGTHEVHVCTESQTIVLRHEAHSRALFAEGAVTAAEWLIGRAPGFYGMRQMLDK